MSFSSFTHEVFKKNRDCIKFIYAFKKCLRPGLKLGERQFKNQETRVALRGRIHQDFETSKKERQVGLGRKREPGTYIPRLKHKTSPGKGCGGCLTSEPLGQRDDE